MRSRVTRHVGVVGVTERRSSRALQFSATTPWLTGSPCPASGSALQAEAVGSARTIAVTHANDAYALSGLTKQAIARPSDSPDRPVVW
jgi:hypothetical protein